MPSLRQTYAVRRWLKEHIKKNMKPLLHILTVMGNCLNTGPLLTDVRSLVFRILTRLILNSEPVCFVISIKEYELKIIKWEFDNFVQQFA